jgi:hypothetical protein
VTGCSSARRGKKYSILRAAKLDNGILFEAALDNGLSLPQNDFHSEYQLTDGGAEDFEVATRLRAISDNGQTASSFFRMTLSEGCREVAEPLVCS